MSKQAKSRRPADSQRAVLKRTAMSLALTLCGLVGPVVPALAADSSAKLQIQVQELLDRIQKVEQSNLAKCAHPPKFGHFVKLPQPEVL